MDNWETVRAYKSALWAVSDALNELRQRLRDEEYRTEYPDEAVTITAEDVEEMRKTVSVLRTLCPVQAVKVDGRYVHKDERDTETLRRCARFGKAACDDFFGPGVVPLEYFC